MKRRTQKKDSQVIVYDADEIEQAESRLFDEEAWKRSEGLVGLAEGRGSALLLETPFGSAVLRRYLRGGWAVRFSKDRYLFTGYQRSRPLAEFDMLARLRKLGLPVPHPLAAQCKREGMFYTGSLMTRRIPGVVPLVDLLGAEAPDDGLWSAIGKCIRDFHQKGAVHADLNARNILIADPDVVYLIDFDRARMGRGRHRLFESNLRRLRRSLNKHWPAGQQDRLESSWALLLQAYYDESGVNL